MSHPTSPLRVALAPRFRAFFAAAFLSAFNDNVFKNGVALLVMAAGLTAAGMPAETVVLVAPAVFIVPFFLLSATAGQLADRFEGTRMIRAVKLAEIPIMGIAAVAATLAAPATVSSAAPPSAAPPTAAPRAPRSGTAPRKTPRKRTPRAPRAPKGYAKLMAAGDSAYAAGRFVDAQSKYRSAASR